MRFILGLIWLAPIFVLGLLALAPAVLNVWVLYAANQSGVEINPKAAAQGVAGVFMSLIPAAILLVPAMRRRAFGWTEDDGTNAVFGVLRLMLFAYVMWRFVGKFGVFDWPMLAPLLAPLPFWGVLFLCYFIAGVWPCAYGRGLRAAGDINNRRATSTAHRDAQDRSRYATPLAAEKSSLGAAPAYRRDDAQPTYRVYGNAGDASFPSGPREAPTPVNRAIASSVPAPTNREAQEGAPLIRKGVLRLVLKLWTYLGFALAIFLAASAAHGKYAWFLPDGHVHSLISENIAAVAACAFLAIFPMCFVWDRRKSAAPFRRSAFLTGLAAGLIGAVLAYLFAPSLLGRGAPALLSVIRDPLVKEEIVVTIVSRGDESRRRACDYRLIVLWPENAGGGPQWICGEGPTLYEAADAGTEIILEGYRAPGGFRYREIRLK